MVKGKEYPVLGGREKTYNLNYQLNEPHGPRTRTREQCKKVRASLSVGSRVTEKKRRKDGGRKEIT